MKISAFIFNSEKKFWNWTTRQFQKEKASVPEAHSRTEFLMASRSDDTADLIYFDEATEDRALNNIKGIEMTERHLKVLKEMNSDYLRNWEKF